MARGGEQDGRTETSGPPSPDAGAAAAWRRVCAMFGFASALVAAGRLMLDQVFAPAWALGAGAVPGLAVYALLRLIPAQGAVRFVRNPKTRRTRFRMAAVLALLCAALAGGGTYVHDGSSAAEAALAAAGIAIVAFAAVYFPIIGAIASLLSLSR